MDKEQHILGNTAKPFLISSRKENYSLLLDMLNQAQQDVVIFSHSLDGQLYDTTEFIEALRQLALNNKHSQSRILIQEMDFLVKNGHRIIELARRLPTSIEIRKVNHQFDHINTSYAIVDRKGIVLRNDAYRYDAKVDFHDPRLAKDLLKQFNEMWEQSEPSMEMQRLHI